MKLVCAWCGVTIERPGYSQTLDPGASHGMCPACYEALVAQESGVSLQRHIDSIPIPILLVDSNDAVVAMNAKAGSVLGKKLDATAKQPFGQVFDCIHSRLPEGCGRTIHCSGCQIRRSVAMTFETGEPQVLVPATLSLESPDQLSDAVLTITTVKRDELVLLRIEKAKDAGS
jgi:nitrogen-specific signal transduction histidine kinase